MSAQPETEATVPSQLPGEEEDSPMPDADTKSSALPVQTSEGVAPALPPSITITNPDPEPSAVAAGTVDTTPHAALKAAAPETVSSTDQPIVRVFNPAETPSAASTPCKSSADSLSESGRKLLEPGQSTATQADRQAELDEAFFEPTLSDVQKHHASQASYTKRLNDGPLLTSKHRDEEKEGREKRKAERWPSTTIRIKFSDGTQVQSSFPSSSPIQPVYAFVRTCLDPSASSKPFTLWQPPRFSYPEHPIPPAPGQPSKPKRPLPSSSIVIPANYGPVRGAPMPGLMGGTGGRETLGDLGLVPQSMLMIRWGDDEMNATGYPAPLLPELRQKAEPLPNPTSNVAEQKAQSGTTEGGSGDPKEKKIPKWLAKGLMKRKK